MVQSDWSPTAHLQPSVNSYSKVIARAFKESLLCLFAIQPLSNGQGQVQILFHLQSHYLLLLGV